MLLLFAIVCVRRAHLDCWSAIRLIRLFYVHESVVWIELSLIIIVD